jgi:hypothetical protein
MAVCFGLSRERAIIWRRHVGDWQRALGFLYILYDKTL